MSGFKNYWVLFLTGPLPARWLISLLLCRERGLVYRGPHPTRYSCDVYQMFHGYEALRRWSKRLKCDLYMATGEESSEVHL